MKSQYRKSQSNFMLIYFLKTNVIPLSSIFMKQSHSNNTGSHSLEEQASRIDLHLNQHAETECRICLDSVNEEAAPMIAPCSCSGSVKYVHEECLKKWIEKMIEGVKEKPSKGKAHVSCQLCGSNIYFSLEKVTKFNSPAEINQSIKSKPKMFIVFIIILLMSLGFFFALLDFMINSGWKVLENYNAFLIILMICAQVVFSSIALTMLGLLAKNYLTFQVFQVTCLKQINLKSQRKTQEVTKKHLIYPKDGQH